MSQSLRLHRLVERTTAEGPGVRAALWVQGCSIRCPGCFNPHTWTTRGGRLVDADELGDRIAGLPDIEGVTFLGGEPFEQAGALARVAARVAGAGLSVMSFSGFTMAQLVERGDPDQLELLARTDLLADGPFLQDEVDLTRPWIGSRNQRLRALTPRYAALIAQIEAGAAAEVVPNRLEVRLAPDGTVFVNGMATRQDLEALRRSIRS